MIKQTNDSGYKEAVQFGAGSVSSGSESFGGSCVHFVGIGGIGMSGIASLLLRQGYVVSGSDVKESLITKRLAVLGARIFIGHAASNVGKANAVIYSSAIKANNPELVAAHDRGIRIFKRAEALTKLMDDKICIAVSGAHGKTTTTSLVTHLLLQAGFFPTAAIGGVLRNLDDNAHLGSSRYFIAEADESDGTFLYYKPEYSIVTNIDREHLDYYGNWENIVSAYAKFINNTKESGCLFCCGDDLSIRQITKNYKGRIVYFGLSKENDFYPDNLSLDGLSCVFNYRYRGKLIGKIRLPLAGKHNVSNSLSVVALGWKLGIDFKKIEDILNTFKGTERRFQLKGDFNNIKIIDDYGHHPSEIKATLEAAKSVEHKRLIVVFQPHRYSRTKFLMEDFATSFGAADYLFLADIYPASEEAIPGVSSECLGEKIKQNGIKQVYCIKKEVIAEYLIQLLQPGDLVLTLGAGDIGKISDELVQRIKG